MSDLTSDKRMRWAGLLVVVGLAIQSATLLWRHPASFIAFLVIGSPLTVAGVLLYLYSLFGKSHG